VPATGKCSEELMCARMANWIARWHTCASATWPLQWSVPVWQARLDSTSACRAPLVCVCCLLCKCSEPLNKENIRRAAVLHTRSSGCCGRDRRTEHVCVGDPSRGGRGEPRVDDPRILQTCDRLMFFWFRLLSLGVRRLSGKWWYEYLVVVMQLTSTNRVV
jgi:hypothetical protein